jgi:hypothetical protein
MNAVSFICKALGMCPKVSFASSELKGHFLHGFCCAHPGHVIVHCHEAKFADDRVILLKVIDKLNKCKPGVRKVSCHIFRAEETQEEPGVVVGL